VRKVLISVVVAAILVVGGFIGYKFYVQYRIDSEIEAAFAQVRAAGGQASHGKISFDPLSRTVKIADIAAEVATPVPVRIRVASLMATGVSLADETRLFAEAVETAGVEFSFEAGWSTAYKLPSIIIKDLSGPAARALPERRGSGADDVYLWALQRLAAVSATSITAPSITAIVSTPGAAEAQSVVYTYTNVALRDVRDGRIATSRIDRASFTGNIQQNGKTDKIGGEFAKMAAYDFDLAAALAIFDPARANDDGYVRVYRQVTCGAYELSVPGASRLHMDGFEVDDVKLRPSKLQLPQLRAIAAAAPKPGTMPTPAQTRDLMQKVAGLYESIHIGNAEMHGIAMDFEPEGSIRLASLRSNLDDGRISEFTVEGLDVPSAQRPFKIGHLALKAIDIAGMVRWSSEFAAYGQQPTPGEALSILRLISGVEIKNLVGPYKNTDQQIRIDTLSLNWGQFVGPIPTQAHLVANVDTPIEANDPVLKPLLLAGVQTTRIDVDLGAAWAETSGTFGIEPATIEIGNLLKASAGVSLAHVPREAFSSDLQQAMTIATQVDAGTLELTLHDLGGVDLMVAQYARAQNISRDDARRAISESAETNAKAMTDRPEVLAAAEALVHFIETPGQTLIIKLTPLGKVPALQLLQLLKTDPITALAQFQIEASTGL
jgi:hypothetical protein